MSELTKKTIPIPPILLDSLRQSQAILMQVEAAREQREKVVEFIQDVFRPVAIDEVLGVMTIDDSRAEGTEPQGPLA